MELALIECPTHTGHAPSVEIHCGRRVKAFDQVARMDLILAAAGIPDVDRLQPTAHGLAPVLRVHDAGMVAFLQRAWPDAVRAIPLDTDLLFADTFFHAELHHRDRDVLAADAGPLVQFGFYCFDTITGIGEMSANAALGAVDTALTGAGLLQSCDRRHVVALSRPPGHHVGRRLFGGGCYLNNAAVAAQALRDGGAARVAILDIDFHHGNGTQDVFYADPTVLYVSLHGDPRRTFPYYTGHEDEHGEAEGLGFNVNLPLPSRIAVNEYRRYLDRGMQAIQAFGPEYLVVSLGFDTMDGDPSGDGALLPDDYEFIGHDIAELDVPTLAVLEGGYRLDTLGLSCAKWMAGLAAGL